MALRIPLKHYTSPRTGHACQVRNLLSLEERRGNSEGWMLVKTATEDGAPTWPRCCTRLPRLEQH